MAFVDEEGAQGLCPDGWYLPTDEDWKALEGEIDSQFNYPDPEWDAIGWRGYDAGNNLREAGGAHWSPPNIGATNSSGFTAFGGGYRVLSGGFYDINTYGIFWSSTGSSESKAFGRDLSNSFAKVHRIDFLKTFGFSVRCL